MMVRWRLWKEKITSNQTSAHRTSAKEAYNKKEYDNAENHLHSLLKESPNDKWALDVLGRLLMNTSRHEDAAIVWNKYMLAGGDMVRAKIHLSKCQRVLGDFENALDSHKFVLHHSRNYQEVMDEIHKTIDLIDNLELIYNFHSSLEDVGTPQIILDSVQLRIDIISGNSAAAAQTYMKIFSENESEIQDKIRISSKWRIMVAEILLNAGLLKEAVSAVSTLDLDNPRRSSIEITANRLLGEYGNASKIFDQLSEGESKDHGVLLSSIRLNWDMGEMNRVIELSETLLRDKPFHAIATRFRIQALVKIANIQQLRAAVDETLALSPQNLQALRTALDLAFSEDCDWGRSVELCEKIIAIDELDRRALCHKAIALSRLDLHDESRRVLQDTKSKYPENNEVDLAAAEVERQLGNGIGQIECINRIFKRNGYLPIKSDDSNHRLNIQHLSVDDYDIVEGGPLVSVIMTAYKKDELLDIAIDSVLNQTHSNLELIVVDDLSPDDTFEYLQSRAKNEPRLRVFQTSINGGTYLAKNLGLTHSRGEFIAFMDSDDWTHPQRIENQLKHFNNDSLMGTCDAYFRIDDDSHIPYRGKGASRMACISLLMRRAVFERNGYFDAIRVGADTEYIERISASFGEDGFNFIDIPTMLMTQHGTSLTGGGRFHISWRSITGYRLEHHSSFRAWHKKIHHGEVEPYLPHPLRVRPFSAPEEMLSGQYQWKDGIPLFSDLISQRNNRWWFENNASWQSHFSSKIQGRLFANRLGVSIPKMYWHGSELSDLPEFDDIPSKVVIKPSVGWNSNNVFCLIDGVNVLDDEEYNRDKVVNILQNDSFLKAQSPIYMCEEFLIPEAGRESDVIPRDYKFYCFGDEIALVHIVLRRSSKYKSFNSHHYLDSNFQEINNLVMSNREVPLEDFPMPDCWDDMVKDVKTLGREMGCFMRIDMYATSNGPVFGEFTPTPEGGNGFTEWADKYLSTFWRGIEGVDEGSITEPPEWIIVEGLM